MNFKKIGIIGAALLVMGSLAMAASNATWKAVLESEKIKPSPNAKVVKAAPVQTAALPTEASPFVPPTKLELVPPPAELPRAAAPAPAPAPAVEHATLQTPVMAKGMVTSIVREPAAGTTKVKKSKVAVKSSGQLSVAEAKADKNISTSASEAKVPQFGSAKADIKAKLASLTKTKVQAAPSTAVKPGKLFSYVRLLNYSPHPQQEEFLKEKPLALNGKQYYFSVAYHEDWNVLSDDEGQLKKIAFDINLYENGKVVRTLKIPATALDPKTAKKGLVLGLAEVAPYKFKIAVDSVTLKNKGIAELIFKFDMSS